MTPEAVKSLLVERLFPRYGSGEASAIARIVLEDVFQAHRRSPEQFTAQWDDMQSKHLQEVIQRLEAGEPVQYVVGSADFFGLTFQVNSAVLIPRQETEELVDWILDYLKTLAGQPTFHLLDIGLGSGCIGITLKKKNAGIRLFGLEVSPEALDVAVLNATKILGEKSEFTFLQGDIRERATWHLFPAMQVIVSNPPYIPETEKALMPEHVLAHEPSLALFVSDEDPLLFYKTIADFALEKLESGGMLFFECNEFNAAQVATMLSEKGFEELVLKKDLSGADRMVAGKRA